MSEAPPGYWFGLPKYNPDCSRRHQLSSYLAGCEPAWEELWTFSETWHIAQTWVSSTLKAETGELGPLRQPVLEWHPVWRGEQKQCQTSLWELDFDNKQSARFLLQQLNSFPSHESSYG